MLSSPSKKRTDRADQKIPPARAIFSDHQRFAETFLKIRNKEMKDIPLRFNAAQRDLSETIVSHNLILKRRQVGVTTWVQSRLRWKEWTGAASTFTLGKDDANTSMLRLMADRYYDLLPENFRPFRKLNNDVITTYPRLGSLSVIGKAGSTGVARGGTVTHFHGSEVAYWPDGKEIMKGAMEAGDIQEFWLESTGNGQQGYFYERCIECIEGEPTIWTLHFYPWFFGGELRRPLADDEELIYTDEEAALVEKHHLTPEEINWRRWKILGMAGSLPDFLEEYPEDPRTAFKMSGVGYFGQIDHVFKVKPGLSRETAHRYVGGLDFGQQRDYTALVVLNATTKRQVDLLRIRHESWREMRKEVVRMCQKWGIQILKAERNSMGQSQIEELREDFRKASHTITVYPFDMTASSKPSLMGNYRAELIDGGLLLLDDPIMRYELNGAKAVQTASGAWTVKSPRDKGDGSEDERSGHGDTVVAGALAVDAIRYAQY
jgi:hypothetical protein